MYYIGMTQPKKPPISIRLPDGLPEDVEAWAKSVGKTRNSAFAELLRRGLAASGPSLPTPDVQAQIKAAVIERQAQPVVVERPKDSAFPRPAYGSRLKKPK